MSNTNPYLLTEQDELMLERPIEEPHFEESSLETYVPQKKKLYWFLSQVKSTTEGEYYWLKSVFAWETFEEYVKAISNPDDIVCYTKVPEKNVELLTDEIPF